MIFYINLFIPDRFAGYTIGPIILIRPSHRNDDGLLAHEQTHVKQFWSTWGFMPLLYLLSKTYRLKYEVEAYKAQIKCYPEDCTERFAEFIATKYNLAVTKEEAVKLLKQ